jgi:purine nucleosidase
MEKVPIILDTDIGSDIDDAVALAYLLRQPRCELLGITTVTGEADLRASLADAVCRTVGCTDIPIHVGVEAPLLVPPLQPRAPQAEALAGGRWPHRTFSRQATAIDFLRETIRSRPGEVTLLPIGPLTNIALLFALDPEIPGLLKQIVLMGGQFFRRTGHNLGVTEWNIACDPHAAAMVFAAPVPKLTAVGLDVTTLCTMPNEECRRRFAAAGGPLAPVAAMAEVWFKHSERITFHDPLAAALIFEPSLCATVPAKIAVELVSPYATGQTLILPSEDARHEVAADVSPDAFFAHYFEIVGGAA